MQSQIADILKAKIAPLPFVDKLAGLVKTIETTSPNDSAGVTVRFPASVDNQQPSGNWQYSDMVPNSNKKSVFYFEDQGLKVLQKTSRGFEMESTLRLVGWLNNNFTAGSDAFAIVQVLNVLPENAFNAPGYSGIKITAGNILGVEDKIFSKYTYDEKQRQYLMKPYTAFAIDLKVTFTASLNCMPEYVEQPVAA